MPADNVKAAVFLEQMGNPALEQIWTEEAYKAFHNPALRKLFESETGLTLTEDSDDPLWGFTQEAIAEFQEYHLRFNE